MSIFRILAVTGALLTAFGATPSYATTSDTLTVDEARAIAREAYIYGFPLVDNYRVQYSYFVDRTHPEFKAPWNQLNNTARVYTPDDKAIQTPNSDTPYSQLGADLRSEPLVRKPTGCPRPMARSSSPCACTGPNPKPSVASGNARNCRG